MRSSFTERQTQKERIKSSNFHCYCLTSLVWIPLPNISFNVISKGKESGLGVIHMPPQDKLVKEFLTENWRRGWRHTSLSPGQVTDSWSELDAYCVETCPVPTAWKVSFLSRLNRCASLLLRTRKESGSTQTGAVEDAWDLEPDTPEFNPRPPLTTCMSLGK